VDLPPEELTHHRAREARLARDHDHFGALLPGASRGAPTSVDRDPPERAPVSAVSEASSARAGTRLDTSPRRLTGDLRTNDSRTAPPLGGRPTPAPVAGPYGRASRTDAA